MIPYTQNNCDAQPSTAPPPMKTCAFTARQPTLLETGPSTALPLPCSLETGPSEGPADPLDPEQLRRPALHGTALHEDRRLHGPPALFPGNRPLHDPTNALFPENRRLHSPADALFPRNRQLDGSGTALFPGNRPVRGDG